MKIIILASMLLSLTISAGENAVFKGKATLQCPKGLTCVLTFSEAMTLQNTASAQAYEALNYHCRHQGARAPSRISHSKDHGCIQAERTISCSAEVTGVCEYTDQ